MPLPNCGSGSRTSARGGLCLPGLRKGRGSWGDEVIGVVTDRCSRASSAPCNLVGGDKASAVCNSGNLEYSPQRVSGFGSHLVK